LASGFRPIIATIGLAACLPGIMAAVCVFWDFAAHGFFTA
jgi:phosphoribosylcarboxyaminoimidazole (NCAIR) mutase